METMGSPEALQLLPSHESHFHNVFGAGASVDDLLANSSWTEPILTTAISANLTLLTQALGGSVSVLPVEECDKLRENNASFWLLLNVFCNQTTGSGVNCLEHAPQLTYSSAVRAAVLLTMALLSLVGNVATILSIRRGRISKRMRGRSWSGVYTLILHLSVADLLVTVFCMAGEAAWSYTVSWGAGNLACKLFKFLQMFSLYLSTFVLVLIGVDRFVAVRYPIKSLNTARRLNKLVGLSYGISLCLSIPQLVIFREGRGPFYEEFYQCVTYGFYTEPWQEQLYTTFSLVCMFILPLLILISTYVCTIITISRSEKVFKAEVATGCNSVASDVNRRRLIHRAKMKSLRISVVIVITFIVWWTPYYTMMIIFMFLNPDKHVSEDLRSAIFFFGMSNSLVNPLIYGAFHLWRPRNRRQDSTGSQFRSSLSRQHRSLTSQVTHVAVRNDSSKVIHKDSHTSNKEPKADEEISLEAITAIPNSNKSNNIRMSTKLIQRYKKVLVGPKTRL